MEILYSNSKWLQKCISRLLGKMKLNEDYKKGYNAAICDAIEYLKNEFIDVSENDNPHIESSKILNLEEFVWDFKRKLKKNIDV